MDKKRTYRPPKSLKNRRCEQTHTLKVLLCEWSDRSSWTGGVPIETTFITPGVLPLWLDIGAVALGALFGAVRGVRLWHWSVPAGSSSGSNKVMFDSLS